jgi:transposase-like protein
MLGENTALPPRWRTIAQIARETGITENNLYKLARSVDRNKGSWVRKERRSQATSRRIWWLDTAHPEYRAWLETKGNAAASPGESDTLAALSQSIASGGALSNPQARALLARLEELEVSLQEAVRLGEVEREQNAEGWTGLNALLSTLHALGLSVFSDALDHTRTSPLHWTWGELHGEGCPTLVEAVQAALLARLGSPA